MQEWLGCTVTHVPPEFDKVAWLDADLLFENPNWHAETARLLEEFPVAQLFGEAVFLDRHGQATGSRTGVARAAAEGRDYVQDFGRTHPGFAWAARRSLLERHGLFDLAIAGGGDSLMVCAMFGWWNHPLLLRHGAPIRDALSRWGKDFWRDVQGRVGHVPGRILHLWHGERANRRYVERIDWLNRADFDPEVDLRLGANGLWEWASADPWLREKIRQYFFDRREDG